MNFHSNKYVLTNVEGRKLLLFNGKSYCEDMFQLFVIFSKYAIVHYLGILAFGIIKIIGNSFPIFGTNYSNLRESKVRLML